MVGNLEDTSMEIQKTERNEEGNVIYFAIKGLCVRRTSSISMSIRQFAEFSRRVVTARTPLRTLASVNLPVLYPSH